MLPLIHRHETDELEAVFDGCKHAILHFEMKFPKENFVLIGLYSWFKSLFDCGDSAMGIQEPRRNSTNNNNLRNLPAQQESGWGQIVV